jgi:pyruvate formate lyase activating enzyme
MLLQHNADLKIGSASTAGKSKIKKKNDKLIHALLGFHGDFLMTDLPPTSWKQAETCLATAKAAGLKRVRIGNVHILR